MTARRTGVSQATLQRLLTAASARLDAAVSARGLCARATNARTSCGSGLLEQRLEQDRLEGIGELKAQREFDAAAVAGYRREAPMALEHAKRPFDQMHVHAAARVELGCGW